VHSVNRLKRLGCRWSNLAKHFTDNMYRKFVCKIIRSNILFGYIRCVRLNRLLRSAASRRVKVAERTNLALTCVEKRSFQRHGHVEKLRDDFSI